MLNRLHLTNFCAAVRSTDLLAAGWNSPTPRPVLVLVQYLAGNSLVQYVQEILRYSRLVAGFLKGMFDSSLALWNGWRVVNRRAQQKIEKSHQILFDILAFGGSSPPPKRIEIDEIIKAS